MNWIWFRRCIKQMTLCVAPQLHHILNRDCRYLAKVRLRVQPSIVQPAELDGPSSVPDPDAFPALTPNQPIKQRPGQHEAAEAPKDILSPQPTKLTLEKALRLSVRQYTPY